MAATITPPSANPKTWSTWCRMRPVATEGTYSGLPSKMSGKVEPRATVNGGEHVLETRTSPISAQIGTHEKNVARASTETTTARARSQNSITLRRGSRSTSGASRMPPTIHGRYVTA
jgi:hypothetical protein